MAQLNIGPKQLLDIKLPIESTYYNPLPPINLSEVTIKEVPVYIKQIEKEYIEVPVEKIVETIKEVPVEVIKYVDREIHIIKEVPHNVEVLMERIITQDVKYVPKWVWCIMILEFIIILIK